MTICAINAHRIARLAPPRETALLVGSSRLQLFGRHGGRPSFTGPPPSLSRFPGGEFLP